MNGIGAGHLPHKLQQWGRAVGHPVVGPGRVVKLLHYPLLLRPGVVHFQAEGAHCVLGQDQ